MKAAVIEKQGGLENLVYRDWPDPKPAADEALIRVRACGLNHLDTFYGAACRAFRCPCLSSRAAISPAKWVELGSETTSLQLGDRVVVNPVTPKGMLGEEIPGGMAELAVAVASHLVKIPDGVSFREAACLPVAYSTAQRMLTEGGRLQKGELILVWGASGGVGTACVQIARNLGARVVAAAGDEEKLAKLKALGAHEVINYRTHDFSREAWRLSGKKGVDVVVNFTGGETWVPSLRSLRKHGRLLTCGATAGFEPKTDIRYIRVRELNVIGSNGWTTDDIRLLLDEVKAGRITPIIGRVLPLKQARDAEALIEERGIFGKILLEP